jgi:hypothetical protein
VNKPTNILDLTAKINAKRNPGAIGEVVFICCSCKGEDAEPLLPLVLRDAGGALIVALVCPECDAEVPILNGRVIE